MADASNSDLVTILGPDANFKGELTFEKGMRLQGKFEGKITTPGRLHITKEARIQADIEAGSVLLEGDVKGNITAMDKVELKPSARYEGDIRAPRLVIDKGAVLTGHVTIGHDAVKGTKPVNGQGHMSRPPMESSRPPMDVKSSNGNGQQLYTVAR